MIPTYYYHHINLRCYLLCFGLSYFRCVTYSIHNNNIVTFLFKNFNYILKFIVVICRL